jgi:hypothetical protein
MEDRVEGLIISMANLTWGGGGGEKQAKHGAYEIHKLYLKPRIWLAVG